MHGDIHSERGTSNAPMTANRLAPGFYARQTLGVARDLLGQVIVSITGEGVASGRIVETEAYLGKDDPASHAARLQQGRVEAMWGPPGIAYIYRSYGIHAMLNVVTEQSGEAGAVLIRALEPLDGMELMQRRRGLNRSTLLCSGPGRLCQALGIGLDWHGIDLVTSDRLWIIRSEQAADISVSGRIGISRGQELPWRFWATGNAHVSAHRRAL